MRLAYRKMNTKPIYNRQRIYAIVLKYTGKEHIRAALKFWAFLKVITGRTRAVQYCYNETTSFIKGFFRNFSETPVLKQTLKATKMLTRGNYW